MSMYQTHPKAAHLPSRHESPCSNNTHILGVLLNHELQWSNHMNYALQKGTKWVTQYQRLSKLSKGISAKYMRCFFISVAIPKMLYATDLFLITENRNTKGTR